MAKHYIRTNGTGHIIKAFSSDFEASLEADICINEDGDRHFHLKIKDEDTGLYCLKWDGKKIIDSIDESDLSTVKNGSIQKLKQSCRAEIELLYPIYKQINIQNGMIDSATGIAYTAQDLVDMVEYIEGQRAKCNGLSKQVTAATSLDELNLIKWNG
jgi:hypothetical protein